MKGRDARNINSRIKDVASDYLSNKSVRKSRNAIKLKGE